ncbi:MAG: CRISPR-associated endoribonuclease Cas6 [Sphaerospermopsis sp.]|nr:CRISPR-associated endoribonuclease Cas6 [Sphaerospermopsis sp.]
MSRRSSKQQKSSSQKNWSSDTELIGLEFNLVPPVDASLYPQYTIGLHAWFLNQVRKFDPQLSAYLHDGESEKPFTVSALDGEIVSSGRQVKLVAGRVYRWYVTALSNRVSIWMAQWLDNLPEVLYLKDSALRIESWQVVHPPTTYTQLLQPQEVTSPYMAEGNIALQFISPTSFRRKKHHFPLPVPTNVFQSYLRRWNDFSGREVDQETFLNWVDESVLITRHQLSSAKVLAGKRGAVTGFTGTIEFCLSKEGAANSDYQQLFYALGRLAPYCGTGHKTTFGLGQTRLGWASEENQNIPELESLLAKRIEDLTEIFKSQRKRTGGERAELIATKWATILARREMGESLLKIAEDMEIPYESVKTYVKLARRSLKEVE